MTEHLTDQEWQDRLTAAEYIVLRRAGTERPWSGALLNEERSGEYACKGCGQKLFQSDAKFDSGCGWPSFFAPYDGAVTEDVDFHLGYPRTEIRCSNCDSHLGHVFKDAPQTPTGMRYCMNSVALDFTPDEHP